MPEESSSSAGVSSVAAGSSTTARGTCIGCRARYFRPGGEVGEAGVRGEFRGRQRGRDGDQARRRLRRAPVRRPFHAARDREPDQPGGIRDAVPDRAAGHLGAVDDAAAAERHHPVGPALPQQRGQRQHILDRANAPAWRRDLADQLGRRWRRGSRRRCRSAPATGWSTSTTRSQPASSGGSASATGRPWRTRCCAGQVWRCVLIPPWLLRPARPWPRRGSPGRRRRRSRRGSGWRWPAALPGRSGRAPAASPGRRWWRRRCGRG